ncbi:MAG: hypothetical protein NZM35_07875 [Chitinophagales bacterium]|nr:hypothetical protein [Chitinophagales bacterium]MDW8419201.1 hypothetical protein [Chitinophagales bacterium]
MYRTSYALTWLLVSALFHVTVTRAQAPSGVILKQCADYFSPASKYCAPLSDEQAAQIISQIGKQEYELYRQRSCPARWPAPVTAAFEKSCPDPEFRKKLSAYMIANIPTSPGNSTVILKLPPQENNLLNGITWKEYLYMTLSGNEVVSKEEYEKANATLPPGFENSLEKVPDEEEDNIYLYRPKPKDRLVYRVKMKNGMEYDFTVTFKNYLHTTHEMFDKTAYPVSFVWQMGAPVNFKGEVYLSKQSVTEATTYSNYFADGDIQFLETQTTVLMSMKNFYEPNGAPDRSTQMKIGFASETFYRQFENYEYLGVTYKNKKIYLPCYRYNNAPDGAGKSNVYVQNESNAPLIIKMVADFEIVLKEVVPHE